MRPNLDPVPHTINGYPVIAHRPATTSPHEICEVVLCRERPGVYVTWTWNRQIPGAHQGKYGQPLEDAVTDLLTRHQPVDRRSRQDVQLADDADAIWSAEFREIEWHIRELGIQWVTCSCGTEVPCRNFTSTCRGCGADYNSAGQRLASREVWGEETGEQASDVLVSDGALLRSLDEE